VFDPQSPFLNIPINTNIRQAFFLDGIRHAFEMANTAFLRLSKNLNDLVAPQTEFGNFSGYGKYLLDAWAFVDSVDRLLALWKLQPNADTIPDPWKPSKLKEEFKQIRNIRNVCDHLAQRVDQIVASNSLALVELSWVRVLSLEPPAMKSYLIRPGFLLEKLNLQINLPRDGVHIQHNIANILLKAHAYTANLSHAYTKVVGLGQFAESSLSARGVAAT
jgi:hypothetical protein